VFFRDNWSLGTPNNNKSSQISFIPESLYRLCRYFWFVETAECRGAKGDRKRAEVIPPVR
jgi:hypothetical protein